MGYTEVRLGDEVFFTRDGTTKLKHLKYEPTPPPNVKPELAKMRVELDKINAELDESRIGFSKIKSKLIETKSELDRTKAKLDKIKELEAKEKHPDIVELSDIEKVIDTEEVTDMSSGSTIVSWIKGVFFK